MGNETPQEVRKRLEADGYVLAEPEFEVIMRYTRRKLEIIQKGEDYLPLLLEDEIKHYFFRNTINAATLLMMAVDNNKISKEVYDGTSNDGAISGEHPDQLITVAHDQKGCASARI